MQNPGNVKTTGENYPICHLQERGLWEGYWWPGGDTNVPYCDCVYVGQKPSSIYTHNTDFFILCRSHFNKLIKETVT